VYALYTKKPDLSENFSSIFYDKANNSGSDFCGRFQAAKWQGAWYFTISNQPRYGAEEEEGGRINPSLNLVEAFEKLDNTLPRSQQRMQAGHADLLQRPNRHFRRPGRTAGRNGDPARYDIQRQKVDIWAGYQLANGTVISGDDRGAQKTLPGKTVPEQVVGFRRPYRRFRIYSAKWFLSAQIPRSGSGIRPARGAQRSVVRTLSLCRSAAQCSGGSI
jgi:hypothetical protein